MSSPSFVPGQLYRRRELHAAYGGSYQSGISFSSQAPVVFLFTGESGQQFGYRDGWQPDGTYHYTGEGQVGDMTFTRGNLAIRAHHDDGRGLFLFERVSKPSGHVRFLGQMIYTGHQLIEGVPDRDGTPRRAIVFELTPVAIGPDDDVGREHDADKYADQLPPADPIEARLSAHAQWRVADDEPDYGRAHPLPTGRESRTSRATRTFVLRRAGGHCEGCGAPAPFVRIDGSPYLEPHATRLGSDQELPGPDGTVALCPNCHRRAHFADDGARYNEELISLLSAMPPSTKTRQRPVRTTLGPEP